MSNPMMSFNPVPWMTGMTRRQRKAVKAKRLRQQQAALAFAKKVLWPRLFGIDRAVHDSFVYGEGRLLVEWGGRS